MIVPVLKNCRVGLTTFFAAVLAGALTVSCFAQNISNPSAIRWEADLGAAMARAEAENRFLFLHFVGNDCQPAQQMEIEVFSNAEIAAKLNAAYVMVRINASENTALAQKFSVTAIPTDLILKPNGQLVHRRQGGITADRFVQYLAFLQNTIQTDKSNQSVSQQQIQQQPVLMSNSSASSSAPFGLLQSAQPTPQMAEAVTSSDALRDPFAQQIVATGTSPASATNPLRVNELAAKPTTEYVPATSQPSVRDTVYVAPPITPALPPIATEEAAPGKMTVEVPLALEGFCPVSLSTEERWTHGNPAYCTMYLGHIFRFASMEHLATFSKNPASYIPIAMGEDIVLVVDRNRRVNGNRKFGAWFQGRVFLFSSQETLDAFAARPEYYTEIALKYEIARKEIPISVIY